MGVYVAMAMMHWQCHRWMTRVVAGNVTCFDQPCQRDGRCSTSNGLVVCRCSAAFRGRFCEST